MTQLARNRFRGALASNRVLILEALEDRRMLALSTVPTPWQNPINPLDVNHDGIVAPLDAIIVINQLLAHGSGPLPSTTPTTPPEFYFDTTGDNNLSALDALRIINGLTNQPQITLSTLTPVSPDVTPQVTVTATGGSPLPDGTPVEIDVDINNSGQYTKNYAQGTMAGGVATFDLSPSLPANVNNSPYPIKMVAHVQDSDGIVAYSAPQAMTINTTVSNALAAYVAAPDSSYTYSVAQTTVDPNGLFTIYDIDLTSQTWRSTADVNQPVWQHWERIIVPTGAVESTALLLIDGGSFSSTPPSVDSTVLGYAATAVQLHSVFIDLKDVPNEPLQFTGDNPPINRSEDAILAYTFNQFMVNLGQPGNNTWPALLPMVKSAVRAMDTVQSFVPTQDAGDQITNFMVTGYSKRGWTTWLTAAIDPRVTAIIPGVFDNLDQGAQMVHQYNVYGFFSPAVQDYNNLNIFGRIMTPEGEALSEIVDPYRYLSEPKFATMPKLLINSAGDEFFVSDSAQYYFHDLPGTENYLRYIPNVGHGLDPTDPAESTLTFYNAVVNQQPLPKFSWTVEPDGSINVQTTTTPSDVEMWQATNPTARDFRHAYNPSIVWTESPLGDQGGGVYIGSTTTPATGATAFFVQLTFPSTIPGEPFIFTTEIHVNSTLPLYPWPFASSEAVPAAAPVANDGSNAIYLYAYVPSQNFMYVLTPPPQSPAASPAATAAPVAAPAVLLASASSGAGASPVDNQDETDDPLAADSVDRVFGSRLADVWV